MIQEELQPDVREVVGFGGSKLVQKFEEIPGTYRKIPQNTSLYYIDPNGSVVSVRFWESEFYETLAGGTGMFRDCERISFINQVV